MAGLSPDLAPDLETGDNVLLLCPRFDPDQALLCRDLSTVVQPEREYVLSVLCTDSPRDRIARWEESVGAHPAEAAIISVGSRAAVPAMNGHTPDGNEKERRRVEEVTALGDLTTLGVRIASKIESWREGMTEEQLVVCFDSLTAIAQCNPRDKLLSFVDALTGKVADADGVAHYHADPVAHTDETVESLKGRFDVVYDHEDGWHRPAN